MIPLDKGGGGWGYQPVNTLPNWEISTRSRLQHLSLHTQQEWLLKRLRDPAQKTRGIGAIDQPVIVRERERQNQPRIEFVIHPLLLHPRTRKPQNRDFKMFHDRRESRAADSTKIVDGKCASFHLLRSELAVTRFLRELRH